MSKNRAEVKRLGKYIENIQTKSGISESIITVEHRSNNPKRDYLFVNTKQGKHIPVKPSETIKMFNRLAGEVYSKTYGKKILAVGFAETATAIGNYIANELPNCVAYIQTTREKLDIRTVAEFEEEHSHAVAQVIYSGLDLDKLEFDYVLFLEDEVSTGNTILNCIKQLKLSKNTVKYGVASICNWQNAENKELFKKSEIDVFCLISGELTDANAKMNVQGVTSESTVYEQKNKLSITSVIIPSDFASTDERAGYIKYDYQKEIQSCVSNILKSLQKDSSSILIVGTEEYMFIPLMVASKLENMGYSVRVHATTRSSIDVIQGSTNKSKEVVSKYKLHSAYDTDRTTYIYNLKRCDNVAVITDAICNNAFIYDIKSALISAGNRAKSIKFIIKGLEEL